MRTTLTLFDLAFLAQAATSVAGITPALFNPARWYDAASLSTDWGLDNDAVITLDFPWDDQSSNDDDAVSTVGNEPIFKSNIINGRPVVRFQGAKHLVFEGGDLVLGEFTILCVALTVNDSNYVSRAGFNRQIRTNRLAEPRASWFSGVTNTELVSEEFLSNSNLPRMIGHRRSNNPGVFTFFDNLTSVNPIAGSPGVTGAAFGINQIGSLGEFTPTPSIDIAELVIYDTALTTGEVQTLYNEYFKPKFALP